MPVKAVHWIAGDFNEIDELIFIRSIGLRTQERLSHLPESSQRQGTWMKARRKCLRLDYYILATGCVLGWSPFKSFRMANGMGLPPFVEGLGNVFTSVFIGALPVQK